MRLYHPLIFFVLFFSIPEINNAQITTRNFAISDDADLNDSYTSKSPKGALIRSLILPGWGQVYNRKFIKALVFLGGEFYFMSRYLKLDDELKTLEDTYNAGLASNTITSISALDIEDQELSPSIFPETCILVLLTQFALTNIEFLDLYAGMVHKLQ